MNKKQVEQAMKKLGIQEQPVDATAVIIRTPSEDIIIRNPSVSKVNMMGTWTYSISGDEEHRPLKQEPEFSDEDVSTVMQQAGCSKEEAIGALKKHGGDLAAAIISFTG